MKKQQTKVVRNLVILCAIYVAFIYFGFVVPDNDTSQQGKARGMVVAIPSVMAIFFLATIIHTRKSGGDWKKVRANLKHNFIGLFSFTWKDLK